MTFSLPLIVWISFCLSMAPCSTDLKKWVEVFVEYINIFVIMSLFPFDLGHFLPVPSPFWLHVFYSLLYMSPSSWINTVSSLSEPPIKLMPDKANEFKTATFFPLLVLLVRRYSSASVSKLRIFDKGFPVRAPDAMSSVCLAFSKKDNNTKQMRIYNWTIPRPEHKYQWTARLEGTDL